MIKKISILLLSFIPTLLRAQVTVSVQLPPAGLVQKEQLWNLVLVNNKEDILSLNIRMNLQDAATGQVLMSANSGQLLLGKGVKLISSRDVEPVLYNYTTPDFGRSYLPMGSYVACYQVYKTVGEIMEPVGDECTRLNIDPLGPPLLNTPADGSELETPNPQFTWMPPAPIDLFNNLSYDILVTEINEGQSAVEAIQYNTPVYTRSGIQQPADNYPSAYTALEKDKTYAWQVVAVNGQNYAAKTEVWTFKLKQQEMPVDMVSLTPFIQLKMSDPNKGIAPNGILKIAYYNKYPDKKVKIEILEPGNNDAKQPASFETTLLQGENNIRFDLGKIMQPQEGKVYEARLVNMQQETWYIRFVIKNYK